MKRPTLFAVLDTANAVVPWLVVWWGVWTGDLKAFFLGSLLVVHYGLRRIWRELRDKA